MSLILQGQHETSPTNIACRRISKCINVKKDKQTNVTTKCNNYQMKKLIHLPICLCSIVHFSKIKGNMENVMPNINWDSILYVTISIWGHGEQVEKQKSCISFSENFLLKVRTFIWQLEEEIKEWGARLAKMLQFSLIHCWKWSPSHQPTNSAGSILELATE